MRRKRQQLRKTVKILISILTFLYFIPVFGQKLARKAGAIEIKEIYHSFLLDKNYELTKETTNKENRPHSVLYFDTSGNLIKQVSYGKHYNNDLRLLDKIIINRFEKNNILESIGYETDIDKNINPETRTLYYYNDKGQLVKESFFDYMPDTLTLEFLYEYDLKGNEIKQHLRPGNYYKESYDSSSRIISLQQFYKNKLSWEYKYIYTDTTRITNFKSYYNDGKDYTKQEIDTYRDGKLIQTEEKYTIVHEHTNMTKWYYDKVGVLNKIEHYRTYGDILRLEEYTDIKVKAKCSLNRQVIEKINESLLDD